MLYQCRQVLANHIYRSYFQSCIFLSVDNTLFSIFARLRIFVVITNLLFVVPLDNICYITTSENICSIIYSSEIIIILLLCLLNY